MENKVIVCRCEDVTLEDIHALIKQGYRTIDEIKRVSRAGMGPCQGRTCRMLIAQELAKAYGVSMEIFAYLHPTVSVNLGIFGGEYKAQKQQHSNYRGGMIGCAMVRIVPGIRIVVVERVSMSEHGTLRCWGQAAVGQKPMLSGWTAKDRTDERRVKYVDDEFEQGYLFMHIRKLNGQRGM